MPSRRNSLNNQNPFFSNSLEYQIVSSRFSGFDTVSSTEASTPPDAHITLTASELIELNRACDVLLDQEHVYQAGCHRHQPQLDSREREYRSLRNGRTVLAHLIQSEFPIYLATIEYLSQELARSVRGFTAEGYPQCSSCARVVPFEVAFLLQRSVYCAEHVPHIVSCGRCSDIVQKKVVKSLDTFDGKELIICRSCDVMRRDCHKCGERVADAYMEHGVCQHCVENPCEEYPFRPFSLSLKWVNSQQGTVMQSSRVFSSEVECLLPEYTIRKFSHALPLEAGISQDSSVNGNGVSIEIQTPRLGGAKGEEFIQRMSALLRQHGAEVNRTCGMHIHLDGKGLINEDRRAYPAALIGLWKAALVFEDVFMSFVPYTRRRSHFCAPLRNAFNLIELDEIQTLADAEKLWYKAGSYGEILDSKRHHHHSSRYFAFNLHSLLAQGHLEIRSHSGTTRPRKILEWANLYALVMDAAVAGKFTFEFLRDAEASSLRERTALLFTTIGLSGSSERYFRQRQNTFSTKTNDE